MIKDRNFLAHFMKIPHKKPKKKLRITFQVLALCHRQKDKQRNVPSTVQGDWQHKLRTNSASIWFSLHGCIPTQLQRNIILEQLSLCSKFSFINGTLNLRHVQICTVTVKRRLQRSFSCGIWGTNRGVDEDSRLFGRHAVTPGRRLLMFHKRILSSFSQPTSLKDLKGKKG